MQLPPFAKGSLIMVAAAALAAGCSAGGQAPLASGFPSLGLSPVWAEFGPKPQFNGVSLEQIAGRVSSLLVLDAQNLVVGSASGGVWRSEDAGATWTPTTDAMPNSNIGALAQDPNNPDVLYCGTGEANSPGRASTGELSPRKVVKSGPAAIRPGVGIYRSQDAGRTWSLMPSSQVFERMAISRILLHPQDSRRMLVATTAAEFSGQRQFGLYSTDNGGQTWELLSGTGGFPASPFEVTDAALRSDTPDVVFAGVYRRGIYRSVNGGEDWQPIPIDTEGQEIGRIAFALSPADPDVVYALVGSTGDPFLGLFVSRDGGASFGIVGTGEELNKTLGGQAFYNVAVTADAAQPGIVYVGGVELFRADVDLDDLTVAYTKLTDGDEKKSPHVDYHVLLVGPDGRLYCGNDGGVWSLPSPATTPAYPGTDWRNHNGGPDGRAMATIQFTGFGLHPTDPNILWGGSQDNNTARFGGTLSWLERIPLQPGGFVLADGGKSVIDPRDPQIVWVMQQQGRFFRSTNGGDLFNRAVDGLDMAQDVQFYPPVAHAASDDVTRIATGRQGVFETDSAVGTWTQTSGGPLVGEDDTVTALAYQPGQTAVLYAGSKLGRLFVRSQADGPFVQGGAGLPAAARISGLAVDPVDPQRAYLTIQGLGTGKVFRTLDGGANWSDLTGNLPDAPHNDVAIDLRDPERILYVANDEGVFVSNDEGAHWHEYGVGLAEAPVVDLEIGSTPRRLAAATHGRGLWQVSLFGDTVNVTAPPAGEAPFPRLVLPDGPKWKDRKREG